MSLPKRARCAVIALGGNAISPPNQTDSITSQFRHTRESLSGIIKFVRRGYNLAITHGNGPQVGAAMRRVELSRGVEPYVPLGVLVADTQGSMGYMIEQSLINRLNRERLPRQVVTIITQVLVDQNDPALANPSKFIGQIYTKETAEAFIRDEGWTMKPYNGDDKWRRVVGSPKPLHIVNCEAIRELVQSGVVIIAAGGGGIPVYDDPVLGLEGVDAVIDKDRAAAVLANDIIAEELIILTNTDAVYTDYGKPTRKRLASLSIDRAKELLEAGEFPEGSMGPKIEAAVQFIERGGERAIICALDQAEEALAGRAGTEIIE